MLVVVVVVVAVVVVVKNNNWKTYPKLNGFGRFIYYFYPKACPIAWTWEQLICVLWTLEQGVVDRLSCIPTSNKKTA